MVDPYYYPGFGGVSMVDADSSASGEAYVDLMYYVKDITLTVNGTDYTRTQLSEMSEAGNPLTLNLGDVISFNYSFCLQGRAYQTDDPTQLDENASVKVIYPLGTTYLDGTAVSAGAEAILDDSSLMKENMQRGDSYLRMDISWLLDICSSDLNFEYTDGRVSFYRGTGSDSDYLYIYFPKGINEALYPYATPGYFTISAVIVKEFDKIEVPAEPGVFTPGRDSYTYDVEATSSGSEIYDGEIDSYGPIKVYKKWVTGKSHGDAAVTLTYQQNGTAHTATRTIKSDDPNAYATFTIQKGMTDVHLSEDMSQYPDYQSSLQHEEGTNVYTFVNTLGKTVGFTKKSITSGTELPGAILTVYSKKEDGTLTQVDSWTSTSSVHTVFLTPGNYRLRENTAPAGYDVILDTDFTISSDLEVTLAKTTTSVQVKDDVIIVTDDPLEITVSKVDASGAAVKGAVLSLTDLTTNTLVDQWTTTSSSYAIKYASASGVTLVGGHSYLLREESVPSGYQKANDITFVLNADGTIDNHPNHTIVMVDASNVTPTPTPSGSPGPSASPDPGSTNTPTPGSSSTPGGGGSSDDDDDGGSSDGGSSGGGGSSSDRSKYVHTGDSLWMWVYLVLGLVCLIGSGVSLSVYFGRKSRRNP